MSAHAEFETLVRAHQGAVRAFLRRLTGDTGRADELAQDTFLKAYQMGERLSEARDLRSYLYRMAYRRFLDDRTRDTRRAALAIRAPEPITQTPAPTGQALDIAEAMDRLPPSRRACALLCLALGHSHASAAEITGLPLGTVKSHVTRAKTALQSALEAYAPAYMTKDGS